MEPRKNNKREEKRKKFFAKPEGKLVHHFWNDGRMMMCTEHLKLENWLDRRRKVRRMEECALLTTVIKLRGKNWSGTDKLGLTEEILVEPRNKTRIHII